MLDELRACHQRLDGSPWQEYLYSRGLEAPVIQRALLGHFDPPLPGYERFRGCLCIPYLNGRRDRVLGLRFRRPDPPPGVKRAKYDQPGGQRAQLYGVHLIEEPHVYVTEGEFDALVLRQMNLPGIGVPGAQNFNDNWRWLFRDCEEVSVVFDGDEAGKSGANKVARILKQVVPTTRVVELPIGKDISDLYMEDRQLLTELLTQ